MALINNNLKGQREKNNRQKAEFPFELGLF